MQVDINEYSRTIAEQHRKDYGQFFTHPIVSEFMVDWVLQSKKKTLYDPAFGLGAFYSAISNVQEINFTGSELDCAILKFWQRTVNGCRADIAHEDYLLSWGKSCTNIVCNPPYMRFQKFLNRDAVSKAFIKNLNIRLSGYTNTASAFLLKSLSELNGSGRLAYIMPLEFLNTGYGTLVKKRLIEDGHLVSIINLECEKEAFPDSTTSVGIILYDANHYYSHVDFHTIYSIYSLKDILETDPVNRVSLNSLDPKSKWLPYFQQESLSINKEMCVPLKYYGCFIRGIATGANKFFALKPSEVKSLGISATEVLPCVTRSSQIQQLIFQREDYGVLVNADSPVLLFSPTMSHSRGAETYIRQGEQEGYNTRFLTRTKNPWYRTEKRQPSPLLLGVFSRGGYKVIRNRSGVLNLTCFHGFEPNIFGERYIDHLFLYLTSSTGRKIVSLSRRRYGDALDKFEPNDLNNATVPSPEMFDEIPIGDIEKAVSYAEKMRKMPNWVEEFFDDMKVKTILEASKHDPVQ